MRYHDMERHRITTNHDTDCDRLATQLVTEGKRYTHIDSLKNPKIQTAESAEGRRGRKTCYMLCEPLRPPRFNNKKTHKERPWN